MQLQDPKKQKEFLRKFQNINRKMEEEETASRSVSLGLSYIDLSNFPLDLNALALLSKEQATEAEAIIFYKDGQDVRIGALNPRNPLLNRIVREFETVKKYRIQRYLISHSSFKHMLEQYAKIELPEEKHALELIIKEDANYAEEVKNLNKPSRILSATEILTLIFGAAEQLKASDVHCEPEEHFVKIRLRLDGVLNEIARLPKEYQKSLVSRVKVLSKLKLNVDNIPQDGRFSYQSKGKFVDVRVSTLPSAYGEVMVMRILGNQATDLKLDDLGFTGKAYEMIKNELSKPNGMIITTGPTGSGKTTTLYAFLNQLNQPGINIITLEDPVEYKLEGINQTPIDHTVGLDFASGLRAILRQDPDVIMVGEVRDQETAEVSLQAALTGHVVLSTLHTNDAAGAIPRLLNMGVKPFVIAPALNAIIAQRLVRRLCQDCKEVRQLDPFVLDKVKRILAQIPKSAEVILPQPLKFFHAKGCASCNNLGYKGRIGIYEVIPKSPSLEKLIMQSAGAGEIKSMAEESGMISMVQDGLLKALQGITDVEEVFRVAQE